MSKITTQIETDHQFSEYDLRWCEEGRQELPPPSKPMNIIKLTGVTFALSSALVITSSTLANAQNIQGIVIPKTCSNSYINRGARSNNRSKAVEKALIAWNRIAQQRGFFTFKAAKRPKVKVVVYPSNNTQEIIWKANVIGYPCRFISMRRR